MAEGRQGAPFRVDWRPVLAAALAVWLVSRLAFVLLTVFAGVLNPISAGRGVDDPLWLWYQWDTHWYMLIAHNGYWIPASANFFPLFPAIGAALAHLAGDAGFSGPGHDDVLLAMMLLVSNLGALGGFFGAGLIAVQELGSTSGAWRALRLLAAYPMSLFLAAGYTEGLALAFIGLALYWARSGRWRGAFLMGVLAGLTRSTSVVLVLPLVWEFGRQHGWWAALRARRPAGIRPLAVAGAALLAVAVPLGIGIYAAFLWRRFGDPLLFAHTQLSEWHRRFQAPWKTLAQAAYRTLKGTGAMVPVDLAAVVGFAAITLAAIRRAPFAHTLYMAGLLYFTVATPIPTQPDLIPSAARYLVVAVPSFVFLAALVERRPWLDLLLVACGFVLQAAFTLTFFAAGPVL